MNRDLPGFELLLSCGIPLCRCKGRSGQSPSPRIGSPNRLDAYWMSHSVKARKEMFPERLQAPDPHPLGKARADVVRSYWVTLSEGSQLLICPSSASRTDRFQLSLATAVSCAWLSASQWSSSLRTLQPRPSKHAENIHGGGIIHTCKMAGLLLAKRRRDECARILLPALERVLFERLAGLLQSAPRSRSTYRPRGKLCFKDQLRAWFPEAASGVPSRPSVDSFP